MDSCDMHTYPFSLKLEHTPDIIIAHMTLMLCYEFKLLTSLFQKLSSWEERLQPLGGAKLGLAGEIEVPRRQ